MAKHRLKRKELVESLFYLFSQEYDSWDLESIMEIRIPIEDVIRYLQDRFSVSYSGNQWIFTQIRNYEEETGTRLFDKEKDEKGRIYMKLHPRMEAFSQKKHLYVSQKIKVCNGIYDQIINTPGLGSPERPISLLLGAGSTVFHLANIIADRSIEDNRTYKIFTQNISVINRFLESNVNHDRIEVYTPGGSMDPVTYSVIGSYEQLFNSLSFDYIIQGTSFLADGRLYVEQQRESLVKKEILRKAEGRKILVLTGHEVRPAVHVDSEAFGRMEDFDYLVIPNNRESCEKNIDRMLRENESLLKPEIINWNYRIFGIG